MFNNHLCQYSPGRIPKHSHVSTEAEERRREREREGEREGERERERE